MVAALSPNDRFENVDLLRAFAATAVVVYHVIEIMEWKTFPTTGPLLTFRIGWIGVDLFFVISGFVIARSALALRARDAPDFARNYWVRRLSRIVPLYLLTCILWVTFFSPGFWSAGLTTVRQVASHLTFTHSFWPTTFDSINGVNWTLAIEMQFYLMIALLIPAIARTPGWRIWLVCILIAWAWRGAMFYLSPGASAHVLFMRVTQLPGALDEFGAGIFLAHWVSRRSGPRMIEGGLWLLGAVVAGTLCFGLYWPHAVYWDQAPMVIFWRTSLGAFFLCVLAAAVYLPPYALTWPLRPIRYLGIVSYGIYLWHLFAIRMVQSIPGLVPLQQLGLALGITILLAAASWHLFEKPILDFGHRFRTPASRKPQPAGT